VVLTYVVRSQARVDEILAEAEAAGATILKPAAAQQWAGRRFVRGPPDGYIWDIGTAPREPTSPTRSSRRQGSFTASATTRR